MWYPCAAIRYVPVATMCDGVRLFAAVATVHGHLMLCLPCDATRCQLLLLANVCCYLPLLLSLATVCCYVAAVAVMCHYSLLLATLRDGNGQQCQDLHKLRRLRLDLRSHPVICNSLIELTADSYCLVFFATVCCDLLLIIRSHLLFCGLICCHSLPFATMCYCLLLSFAVMW